MSHTRWFKVRRENGTIGDLGVTTSRIPAGDLDNPHATLEGLPRYHLKNGAAVNRLGPRTYEVVGTGEVLNEIAPLG